LREEVIGGDLFSDPAWDILLDLYAARDRGDRVQVTSIASIAGVPPSTGRRWAKRLVDRGLLERERDRRDQRQTFMRLTPKGEEIMTAFMVRLAEKGMPPLLRN
jgi:DNA-binding MarR family transcriptional regulator